MNRYRSFLFAAVFLAIVSAMLAAGSVPVRAAPSVYAPQLRQGGDATLRLVNDSEETICSVLISPISAGDWGDNWLDDGEPILPGMTSSFDLAQGTYNIRLADCAGNVLLTERRLALAGVYELRFSGPDPDDVLRLINVSCQENITDEV